jgi:DNA-binding CsgD family transcriptional regulator
MSDRQIVSERDLRALVGILASPDDADPADPLPRSILAALHQVIPCDNVTFVRYDSNIREFYFDQYAGDPPPAPDYEALDAAFWTHYWDSPSCSYPDTSADLVTVTTASDFHSDRQFRSTPMYCEYFRPMTIQREMMLCLPSRPGRVLRLLFFRCGGTDFSDRDRILLALLRPHLDAAYREQVRRRDPMPDLTPRQWTTLHMVAAGLTNQQIARRMSITEATVRKNLENIFRRMGVASRTEAVIRAFGSDPRGVD